MAKKYPYEIPLVDNRGTPITVGAKVAYNLSGQIAVGEVVTAKPTVWTGLHEGKNCKIEVKLACKMNTDGLVKKPGKISKVSSPQNVLVLFEGDHENLS